MRSALSFFSSATDGPEDVDASRQTGTIGRLTAATEPHLVIKEGVYNGEYNVYETDRYGMPIGDPIDE